MSSISLFVYYIVKCYISATPITKTQMFAIFYFHKTCCNTVLQCLNAVERPMAQHRKLASYELVL